MGPFNPLPLFPHHIDNPLVSHSQVIKGKSTNQKKSHFCLIPIVIFIIERDVVFALFGLLTSFLFFLSSYYKKDDFVEYGIFHGKQKERE